MNESFEFTPSRLRELRAFAAAARRLNFSRAALDVGCTPSVLSRRIATLEDAVAGRLFSRTTRRMVLTARGERLWTQWQRVEALMTDLAAGLRQPKGELTGQLCVHLPSNYGRYRVAPLLAAFLREHPGVRIEATYDDAWVDMIAVKADLAVRVGKLADSRLVARKMGEIRNYLCASPDYLTSAPPLHDPIDLKLHRCIAFSGLRTGTLWRFGQQRRHRSVRIEPMLTCNDSQAVRDAALAGVGIGIQGSYMADALLTEGRLVEVLRGWTLASFPVHLLWLRGADQAPALRRLIDFLADGLAAK